MAVVAGDHYRQRQCQPVLGVQHSGQWQSWAKLWSVSLSCLSYICTCYVATVQIQIVKTYSCLLSVRLTRCVLKNEEEGVHYQQVRKEAILSSSSAAWWLALVEWGQFCAQIKVRWFFNARMLRSKVDCNNANGVTLAGIMQSCEI